MKNLKSQEELVNEIKEIKKYVGINLTDLSNFIRTKYPGEKLSIATISRILNDKQVDINYKTLYHLSKALKELENLKKKKLLTVKNNPRLAHLVNSKSIS